MNLAAESHVDKSIESPNDFIQTNVIGTFNLLQQSYDYYKNLSLESKNNFKFIHISTDEVFGDLENSKDLFTENTYTIPHLHIQLVKQAQIIWSGPGIEHMDCLL